jgi:hypothetical protein
VVSTQSTTRYEATIFFFFFFFFEGKIFNFLKLKKKKKGGKGLQNPTKNFFMKNQVVVDL